jgi:hypothetical protein
MNHETPASEIGEIQAKTFVAWLVPQAGLQTQRRCLGMLRACWDWAITNNYLSQNPWHTFISHALALGTSASAIAQQTGHSLKILFEHYAGYVDAVPKLPDLFPETPNI